MRRAGLSTSAALIVTRATRSIARYMLYGDVVGWVGGWLSVTTGIVSKPLNLS